LKVEQNLSKFTKPSKFWFYDLFFLDVLARNNEEGPSLFSSLFRNNKIQTILKFLDEESSFTEDLKIIKSVPSKRFAKAVLNRIIYGF
jgi:lycopene beta-cyclase